LCICAGLVRFRLLAPPPVAHAPTDLGPNGFTSVGPGNLGMSFNVNL